MSTEITAGRPAGTEEDPARLHGLDALRAGALGLGIVLHSLMPFVPGSFWVPVDSQSSDGAAVIVFVIHLFRMVLFMVLAGYFGRMVLHRRGAGAYLRDRALRVLLPVVVLWPVAVGSFLFGVTELDRVLRNAQAPELMLPPGVPPILLLLTPAHLWFLLVLTQCVIVTVAVRAIAVRVAGPDRLDGWASRLGGVLTAPLGVLFAAVPYAVALLLQGYASGGIEAPYTVLPTAPSFVGYMGAFLVGWCLHARPDALGRLARGWHVQLGVAVALTALALLAGGAPLVVQAAVVAAAGWTWTFGLVGASTRFLRRENRGVRYLADSSYWVYLLHLPVLAAVQVFLADLSWPIPVKVVLAWLPALALLLISYDLLVRGTWLGVWLNGRRHTPLLRVGRAAQTVRP